MNWIKSNLITHRGLHNESVPENTLEAFQNAVKHGYDIELDIQLTKDNKIIVAHDNNLQRLCGVKKRIDQLDYKELSSYKIGSSNSSIPLLSTVLDSLPNTTNLMIELKTGRKNKILVSLFLDMISKHSFTYVVQSFDPRIIHLFKKKAPHLSRGYIVKNRQVKCILLNRIIKLLPIHSWIKPDFYVYKFEDLPNKYMDKMKKKGYPILSYTAKSQQDLDFVRDRYDNAVFEGFAPKK